MKVRPFVPSFFPFHCFSFIRTHSLSFYSFILFLSLFLSLSIFLVPPWLPLMGVLNVQQIHIWLPFLRIRAKSRVVIICVYWRNLWNNCIFLWLHNQQLFGREDNCQDIFCWDKIRKWPKTVKLDVKSDRQGGRVKRIPLSYEGQARSVNKLIRSKVQSISGWSRWFYIFTDPNIHTQTIGQFGKDL